MSQRLGRGLSESSPHLSADAAHEAPQNCKDKCPGTKKQLLLLHHRNRTLQHKEITDFKHILQHFL